PFKNVFTGMESRDYARAASSQKCVRAGGKHNDLDNVGYTARHHTFFEMLGNFSFGDYFKEDAISFAWELVTKDYGLDANRLVVTVFAEDEEAHALWKKVAGLPDDRIIRIATADNFWSMGETGPCGPCSEIFFDHGEAVPGGPPGSAEEDGDRFIEIWNLVFMQYEQVNATERRDLPKPSIDTGMGLERIAAVLQGEHDNYDTDLFRRLISASADLTGASPGGPHGASHRVIADHLRASCFLIADGVLPSNEGRGYVLRRIMRRAMRHARLLGAADPLMARLVPALLGEMGNAYPDLMRAESLITETLEGEEKKFRRTLDRGLKLLDEAVEQMTGEALPGEVAFKLYDTYGFPVDLTQDALRSRGLGLDMAGFEAAMRRQREEARAAWSGSGEAATETVWFELKETHGATEFLGYALDSAEGVVQAVLRDGTPVDSAAAGDTVVFLANQTPFYAESGGQVGDRGIAFAGDGTEVEITDTQKKLGSLHVHQGIVTRGTLQVGQTLELRIDREARQRIRTNHSATHLLHAALRDVLGDHVAQKGSLVAPDRLRFDFSHPKPVSPEERAQIETIVNAKIRENEEVVTRLMAQDEAIEAGAMALFGEKYGDEVRVLTMASRDAGWPWAKGGTVFSMELCGGTHVRGLGEIGLMRIIAESAVASGVRRIEAVTGEAAFRSMAEQAALALDAAASAKTTLQELPDRVSSLLQEKRQLERELSEARRGLALGQGGSGEGASGPKVREIGPIKLIAEVLDGVPAKDLRGLIDEAKQKLKSGLVAFIAVNDGKAAIAVGVTDDLAGTYHAVELLKPMAVALGGKGGGGRPDFAQGGGPDGSNAEAAIDTLIASIEPSAAA
ncbi:MAG: alanine--tRNA ligase, partial [Pseudomonadota bacterium]